MSSDFLRILAAAGGLAAIVTLYGPVVSLLERPTAADADGTTADCELALGARVTGKPTVIKGLGTNALIAAPVCARGRVVRVVIDAVNSESILTMKDAMSVGIDHESLTFDFRVETADGTVEAAMATLPSLQIGGVRLSNVAVAVVQDGVPLMSVIGTSALGQLSHFELRKDGVHLHP